MPSTPKHRRINGQPQPFEIKQIKENYWWPANCLKTNDKTAASCEDGRLRDTLQGDWHLPHTHTYTPIHCVQREYLLLVGGTFHVGDQSSELTEGSVFRPGFNHRLCRRSVPYPPVPMCFNCFPLFINWFVLLYLTSLLLRSGHSPAVPHLQVSHIEVVPQWDDDEEGVQGSEVSGGNCGLHPPAAGWPCERIAVNGGASNFGCEWKTHLESTKWIPVYFKNILMCFLIEQRSKRNIIGFFDKKDSDNYHTYEKVANILRDDCTFLAAFGWVSHLLIPSQKSAKLSQTYVKDFLVSTAMQLQKT